MMIRVVEKVGGAPNADEEGKEVWYGGYGDSPQDEASLSASILVAAAPELEIGTWYTVSQFEQKIAGAVEDAAVGWTSIAVGEIGVDGVGEVNLPVSQVVAAKMICMSLLEYIRSLCVESKIWIRVE